MSEEPRDDLRDRTNRILEDFVDDEKLRTAIELALELKKGARGWCPNCRKAVQVEINDSKAVVSALAALMDQAKGRPAQAESADEGERIVFIREVRK